MGEGEGGAAITPILLGLAVMYWRVRQRWAEQGEAAFAQPAQGALDRVAGAGADIEFPPPGGCLTGIRMPMLAPSYPGFGQCGQADGGRPVERGQGMGAGGGDVMHRPGFCLRDPQREPVRGAHRLDVTAVGMRFPRVPMVPTTATV